MELQKYLKLFKVKIMGAILASYLKFEAVKQSVLCTWKPRDPLWPKGITRCRRSNLHEAPGGSTIFFGHLICSGRIKLRREYYDKAPSCYGLVSVFLQSGSFRVLNMICIEFTFL